MGGIKPKDKVKNEEVLRRIGEDRKTLKNVKRRKIKGLNMS